MHDFFLQDLGTRATFDAFYNLASSWFDRFYPGRMVTIASSDPDFVLPELKADLRHRNHLMRLGRVEEASALTKKIGILITQHNANKLRRLTSSDGASDIWEKVRAITGMNGTVTLPPA